MRSSCLVLGMLTLWLPSTAHPQSAESLRSDFARETRLLDDAIAEFGRSRAAERSAVERLRQLSLQLDEALEDPNVSLEYLNSLEAQIAAARNRACASLEQTAQTRLKMYDRMERVAAVAREFEERTELFSRAETGLSGMWHLELQPLDLYGLMNLRLQGTRVSGPYRLSNGSHGSLDGTLAGERLALQAIDAQTGKPIATIEARVEPSAGRIVGRWNSLDLSQGLPSMGDWLADKVSSEEEVDLGE